MISGGGGLEENGPMTRNKQGMNKEAFHSRDTTGLLGEEVMLIWLDVEEEPK